MTKLSENKTSKHPSKIYILQKYAKNINMKKNCVEIKIGNLFT
jgi:hypothetical protein